MCAPSPPDYSEQIDKQNTITDRQMDLAETSYADQKALSDKFLPMFEAQSQAAVDAQTKTTARSDQQWEQYQSIFQPQEAAFAAKASEFGSVGRQEQDANRARADVASQFDQADAARAEELAGAGVMPGSGRALALSQAANIEKAKAMASAGDTARRTTESTGLSLLNSSIGIGRGQVATGLQASDLSLRQGASAQGSAGGAVGMAGAAAAGSSAIYGQASSSNQGSASIMNTGFQNALSSSNANMQQIGDAVGAGAMMMSSEKLKDVGEPVEGASEAVEASPASHWKYKKGLASVGLNDDTQMGPMAEDLAAATGGAVSDGTAVKIPAMLGLHHAAIGEQGARIKAIERKLGLASLTAKATPYTQTAEV